MDPRRRLYTSGGSLSLGARDDGAETRWHESLIHDAVRLGILPGKLEPPKTDSLTWQSELRN